MDKTCKKCGNILEAKDSFCGKCGTKIESGLPVSAPKLNNEPSKTEFSPILTAADLNDSKIYREENVPVVKNVENNESAITNPANSTTPVKILYAKNRKSKKVTAVKVNGVTKKLLTKNIVEQNIKATKNSFWEYFFQIFWIAVAIALIAIGGVGAVLLLPFMAYRLIKTIVSDIKKSVSKYQVYERICTEKDIYTDEDGNVNYYRLWFLDKTTLYIRPWLVSEDVFMKTQLDEEFYVVFLEKESAPCTAFRKSEWEPYTRH